MGRSGVQIGAYSVRNGAAHGCDDGDAASSTMADHLLRHRLRRHEHTGNVDLTWSAPRPVHQLPRCTRLKHGIRIFLRVL